MRDDDLPPHQHQVVDADARPLAARAGLLPAAAANAQLGAHLTAPVQEHPDGVALLDLAHPAGDVGAVVEDEREHHLRRFDAFLQGEELLAEALARLRLPQEGGLCERFGGQGEQGVGAEAALRKGSGGWRGRRLGCELCVWGRGMGRCGFRGSGRGVLVVVVVVPYPEGELPLGRVFALLLLRRQGRRRRSTALVPLVPSPLETARKRTANSPVAGRHGVGSAAGGEAAQTAARGFALFLLESLGAPFAEVGEVHQPDGLRFEQVFRRRALGCEARGWGVGAGGWEGGSHGCGEGDEEDRGEAGLYRSIRLSRACCASRRFCWMRSHGGSIGK